MGYLLLQSSGHQQILSSAPWISIKRASSADSIVLITITENRTAISMVANMGLITIYTLDNNPGNSV